MKTAQSCEIGFEARLLQDSTTCECAYDPRLEPHFEQCSISTHSIIRQNTTAWISYVYTDSEFTTDNNYSGYLIYPVCPFDYCQPPNEKVEADPTLKRGSDVQCNFNRTGLLCSACKSGYHLSLGTSHC